MRGMRWGLAVLVVLAIGGTGSVARAQGTVPGGWSLDFGYQPFAGAQFSGGYTPTGMYMSYGMTNGPAGVVTGMPPIAGYNVFPMVPQPPRVANGLVPLSSVIQQSVRRRSVR